MIAPPPNPAVFPPQTVFDYHRTIVGYHGTRKKTADSLVNGAAFGLRISLHRDQAFRGIVITRFAHRDRLFRAS